MATTSSNFSVNDVKHASSMGIGMKATIGMIRGRFPRVKDVTTETLDSWMHQESHLENVVLMDCRDQNEFAVSHLKGACCVDWQKAEPHELLDSLPSDRPSIVVCYCSVGYRSSALADRLKTFMAEKKYSQSVQVFNLEGSIFKWANEGRSMIDASGQPTSLCHPYNAIWGQLLNKELRSSTSPSAAL